MLQVYHIFEGSKIEAAVGFAPTNNGFADRRVSYFATRPLKA
jgi:hypothetical protein